MGEPRLVGPIAAMEVVVVAAAQLATKLPLEPSREARRKLPGRVCRLESQVAVPRLPNPSRPAAVIGASRLEVREETLAADVGPSDATDVLVEAGLETNPEPTQALVAQTLGLRKRDLSSVAATSMPTSGTTSSASAKPITLAKAAALATPLGTSST